MELISIHKLMNHQRYDASNIYETSQHSILSWVRFLSSVLLVELEVNFNLSNILSSIELMRHDCCRMRHKEKVNDWPNEWNGTFLSITDIYLIYWRWLLLKNNTVLDLCWPIKNNRDWFIQEKSQLNGNQDLFHSFYFIFPLFYFCFV